MERKYKVGTRAAGDNSDHGNDRSKKVALEKLHQMEWVRNKQDSWQSARSSSRSGDFQERKKYNKEEDSYFEGTSVQKTKKVRKQRVNDNSQSIPTGFTVSNVPAAPPPVNAWTKKKGSALFRREDEVDEDEMLKIALQESIKTAEEEERFRRKLSVPSQNFVEEKNWDEENCKEELSSSHNELNSKPSVPDLHFVDTDSDSEEMPVIHQRKSLPARNNKLVHFVNNGVDSHVPQKSPPIKDTSYKNSVKASQIVVDKTGFNEFFEPSRPQEKFEKPVPTFNANKPTSSCIESTCYPRMHQRPFLIPEKDQDVTSVNDDLSSSFKSNLTFGDTQDLFEKLHDNYNYKPTGVPQMVTGEASISLSKDSENSLVKPCPGSTPSETDIMLHSFIRHDPPSNPAPQIIPNVKKETLPTNVPESNNMFSDSQTFIPQVLNTPQPYTTCEAIERVQHSVLNGLNGGGGVHIVNGQDSSSSVSGSPPQNFSPYGSLEKQPPPVVGLGLPTSVSGQIPYPFSVNAPNCQDSIIPNPQSIPHVNQNIGSHIPAEPSAILPGMRPIMPLNSQVGVASFCLPNSNLILPPFQGQDLRNMSAQAYQHHLMQQIQLMNILNDIRLQQAQRATLTTETSENFTKEQNNCINNSQTQNQPQLLVRNQPHVMQLPNQLQLFPTQNQQQITQPLETANQDGLQQQSRPLGGETPSLGVSKELFIKYQKTVQELNELTQQMQQAQIHPAHIQLPQIQPAQIHSSQIQPSQILPAQIHSSQIHPAQIQPSLPTALFGHPPPGWGVYSPNAAIPLGMNQLFPGMQFITQPQLIQQTQDTGQLSPHLQETHSSLTGQGNIVPERNSSPNLNSVQGPDQTQTEPKTGRGRGRIH